MVYRYLWHGHFVKRILAGFPPENLPCRRRNPDGGGEKP
jgi:hypothetical protein